MGARVNDDIVKIYPLSITPPEAPRRYPPPDTPPPLPPLLPSSYVPHHSNNKFLDAFELVPEPPIGPPPPIPKRMPHLPPLPPR